VKARKVFDSVGDWIADEVTSEFSSMKREFSSLKSRADKMMLPTKGRSKGQTIVWASIVGAALGSLLFLPIGFLSSQFFPFFGGWLSAIAEPFSPARLQLMPAHLIGFGILGGLLGALSGAAIVYLKPNE
jgi:hypothetical protein